MNMIMETQLLRAQTSANNCHYIHLIYNLKSTFGLFNQLIGRWTELYSHLYNRITSDNYLFIGILEFSKVYFANFDFDLLYSFILN